MNKYLLYSLIMLSPDGGESGGTEPTKTSSSEEPGENPKASTSSTSSTDPKLTSSGPDPQLEELRKQAEAARKEAEELRKWKEEQERKEMTAIERAQAEAEEAKKLADQYQTEARELRVASTIRERLAAEGLQSPNAVLISGIRQSVDLDDSGAPSNLDAVVENLRETYPMLFEAQGETTKTKTPTSSGESPPKPGDRGAPEDELSDAERAKQAFARSRESNSRV